jgi:putative oxidoreductase
MMVLKLFSKAQPWSYQLMRVVVGLLYACHGAQKLFGVLGFQRVPVMTQRGAAGIIEFFGGLLIAAGVAVTPVAFICSGEMAAAFFQAHWPKGFWPIQTGGELAVLYSFVFLYISTRGAR